VVSQARPASLTCGRGVGLRNRLNCYLNTLLDRGRCNKEVGEVPMIRREEGEARL